MTHEEIEAAIKRLSELEEKKSYLARDVMRALIGRDFPDLYGNIGTLKALLRQADPDTHMLLPVDANGEPIHVGDKMRWRDGETFEVNAISSTTLYYYDETSGRMEWAQAADKYHYHKPTVKDVLRVFARTVAPEIVWDDEMHDELLGKYADRLREVMADDDAR